MATVHWTDGRGGVWSSAADWSDGAVPGLTDDVVIDAAPVGTGYTVFVNGEETVNSLGVIAAATVQIAGGDGLTLAAGTGAGSNAGAIDIDAGGLLQTSGTFDNAGRISLLGSAALLVDGSILNAGTIEGGDGTILLGGTISGGVLGGNHVNLTVASGATGELLGVAIAAGTNLTADAAGTLLLGGTVANGATLTVADLYVTTATLTGGGSVVLTDVSGRALPFSGSLVNVNNTITGSGVIAAETVDNQLAGVIDATGSQRLVVFITSNEGLLEATAGAGLEITAPSSEVLFPYVENTGTIFADDANVYLDGEGVNGGTLRSDGAAIEVEGGGQAVVGQATLVAGSTLAVAGASYAGIDVALGIGAAIEVDAGALGTSLYSMTIIAGSSLEVEGGAMLTSITGVTIDAGGFVQVTSGAVQTSLGDMILDSGSTLEVDVGADQTTFWYSSLLSGAYVQLAGTAVVSYTTISAGATLQIGSGTVTLGASLTDLGTILMDGAGATAEMVIETPTLTLSSGGLFLSDADGSDIVIGGSTADALWNDLGTISGAGQLGDGELQLVNLTGSTIEATGAGTLVIDTGGDSDSERDPESVVNFGVLASVNAGTGPVGGLTITNSVVASFSPPGYPEGTIEAIGANTHVDLTGSTDIEAGTFVTANGGVVNVTDASVIYFDGSMSPVTLDGTIAVQGGATMLVNSRFVNSGTIELAGTGYITTELATLSGGALLSATLTGGGQVELGNYNVISGYDLINVDNTISGIGVIGGFFLSPALILDNQAAGVIDGNDSTGLFIYDVVMSNEGVLEATSPGQSGLEISDGATITNTGTILATDDSAVWLTGGTIIGGLLTASLDSTFVVFENSTLSGVTLSAGSFVLATSVLDLLGTIDNAGTFDGDLQLAATAVTMTGGGVITLGQLSAATAGDVLVNVNNTVDGGGTIGSGVAFDNQVGGVIDGNAGMALVLATAGQASSNAGLIEATSSLEIAAGTTITNTGSIQVNGGTLFLDGAIIGGTLGGSGAVVVQGGSASLSSVALGAGLSVSVDAAATLTVGGIDLDSSDDFAASGVLVLQTATLTNTGTIQALSGGAASIAAGTDLTNLTGTTLTGGTWGASGNAVLAIAAGGPLITDAATILLSGAGSEFSVGGIDIETSLTTIAAGGSLDVLGGRGYSTANTFLVAGALVLAGGTFSAGGLTVSAGGALSGSGSVANVVANAGTVIAQGGALVLAEGASGAGALQVDALATLELAAATSAGTVADGGVLLLEGIALTAASVTFAGGTLAGTGTVAAAVGGGGTIDAAGGLLVVDNAVSGDALAAGAAATLDLAGNLSMTAVKSGVTLNGAGSVIETGSGTGSRTLEQVLTTVAAGGTLAVLGGRGFAAARALTDNGTLTLNGGTLSAASLTLGAAGKLIGYGSIANAVAGAGTVESLGGLLTLAAGATGSSTVLVEAAATLDLAAASAAGTVIVAGTLQLGGVTLAAGSVAIERAGRVTGGGTVGGGIADAGTIEASGALKLAGAVTGAGVLQIDSGATLELAAATTAFIGFAGATGTVQLDAPGSVAARIAGFTGSDVINLGGAVASGLSYNTASKLLTVTGASGTIASLGFSGTYAQANFTLNPAGTDILFVATPLTAQTIGAAPPGFLPPPDTGVAPAPAWTWDGAGAAAGLPTWCPLPPQQPFGQTADPAAVPGGTALAWGLDRTHSPIPAPPHQPFGGQ